MFATFLIMAVYTQKGSYLPVRKSSFSCSLAFCVCAVAYCLIWIPLEMQSRRLMTQIWASLNTKELSKSETFFFYRMTVITKKTECDIRIPKLSTCCYLYSRPDRCLCSKERIENEKKCGSVPAQLSHKAEKLHYLDYFNELGASLNMFIGIIIA